MMTDSQRLLADYAKLGSEAAFRELVVRYLDLVYTTAVRLAGGDTHLAEDMAQTVFVDLARLAKSLSSEVRLGGWLHRHTCFVAAKTLRGERRRQSREKEAAEMNALTDHSEARLAEVAPILDEAINQLGATDRAAVLLRFYERLDFRSVGEALGTTEAAAQKRVTRALEKLHVLLKHRGAPLSIVALGSALTFEAVKAAPVGLATSISGTAVASAAARTGNIFTLLRYMASTKLKTSVIAAIIVASVMTPLLVQRQAQVRLRQQDENLRQQSNQLLQLTEENQRLAGLLVKAENSRPSSDSQFRELLRLRGEVGRLRDTVQKMTVAKTAFPLSREDQLASLAKRTDRLKKWVETHPAEKIPEFSPELESWTDADWRRVAETLTDNPTEGDYKNVMKIMRANAEHELLDKLHQALKKYSQANNGEFPANLVQLEPYFNSSIDAAILQRYEIVPKSSLVSELQPDGDWVITQKAPVNPALDLRMAYGLTSMRVADERISNRWTFVPTQ